MDVAHVQLQSGPMVGVEGGPWNMNFPKLGTTLRQFLAGLLSSVYIFCSFITRRQVAPVGLKVIL